MKEEYNVRLLCRCLNVSKTDYYYHKKHPVNSYTEANIKLDIEILDIYDASNGRYGSPKITEILKRRGIIVSQKRVARRMKFLNIKSVVVKKFNHAGSKKTENDASRKNLLNQDFKAEKPGIKWVGDITYIYTVEYGWTYLAIVMDLFDLKVIGYSYNTSMTDELTINALNNAIKNRHINEGLIFHSDQGSQYISNDFEQTLKDYNIIHSYSKKGYPYDNASMESFNSILKKEEVNLVVYKTFEEAKLCIFEFIEGWYNTRRIHSSLGYLTPLEKMQKYELCLS